MIGGMGMGSQLSLFQFAVRNLTPSDFDIIQEGLSMYNVRQTDSDFMYVLLSHTNAAAPMNFQ